MLKNHINLIKSFRNNSEYQFKKTNFNKISFLH